MRSAAAGPAGRSRTFLLYRLSPMQVRQMNPQYVLARPWRSREPGRRLGMADGPHRRPGEGDAKSWRAPAGFEPPEGPPGSDPPDPSKKAPGVPEKRPDKPEKEPGVPEPLPEPPEKPPRRERPDRERPGGPPPPDKPEPEASGRAGGRNQSACGGAWLSHFSEAPRRPAGRFTLGNRSATAFQRKLPRP